MRKSARLNFLETLQRLEPLFKRYDYELMIEDYGQDFSTQEARKDFGLPKNDFYVFIRDLENEDLLDLIQPEREIEDERTGVIVNIIPDIYRTNYRKIQKYLKKNTKRASQKRSSRGCTSCRKAKQEVEIFNFPGSNKDLEKASSKAWPDVTYKGEDIINFIGAYEDEIRSDFEDSSSKIDGAYSYMQECYGGYDIKTDTYYMGFDVSIIDYVDDETYGEYTEEVPGWALFSIKKGKIKWFDEGLGGFYPAGMKAANKLRLAHLRLD